MSTTTPPTERSTTMCRAVTCRKCSKPTWAGCGNHADQVLAGVARADRCAGHPREAGSGLLSRILGRTS